jgi:hypothetical protein
MFYEELHVFLRVTRSELVAYLQSRKVFSTNVEKNNDTYHVQRRPTLFWCLALFITIQQESLRYTYFS